MDANFFIKFVELGALRSSAIKRRAVSLPEGIKNGLFREWQRECREVMGLTTVEDLEKDLQKPYKGFHDPEGSVAKAHHCNMYGEYPDFAALVQAAEKGIQRYKDAISKPIPQKWGDGWDQPDTLLVRFPELIGGLEGGALADHQNLFWMAVYDGQLQVATLEAGQKISPPWYTGDVTIGFGDVRNAPGSKSNLKMKMEIKKSPGSYYFICPTPEEFFYDGGIPSLHKTILKNWFSK